MEKLPLLVPERRENIELRDTIHAKPHTVCMFLHVVYVHLNILVRHTEYTEKTLWS